MDAEGKPELKSGPLSMLLWACGKTKKIRVAIQEGTWLMLWRKMRAGQGEELARR